MKVYQFRKIHVIMDYLLIVVFSSFAWLWIGPVLTSIILLYIFISEAYRFGFKVIVTKDTLTIRRVFKKSIQVPWQNIILLKFAKGKIVGKPNLYICFKGIETKKSHIIIPSRILGYSQLIKDLINKIPENKVDFKVLRFVQKPKPKKITTYCKIFGFFYLGVILTLIFLRHNLILGNQHVHYPNIAIVVTLYGACLLSLISSAIANQSESIRSLCYKIIGLIIFVCDISYAEFASRSMDLAVIITIVISSCLLLWALIITWFPKLIFRET